MTEHPTPPKGRLFLVPAPLDFGCEHSAPLDAVLPAHTLATAAGLHYWICENAKSTRAYLKRVDAITPLAVPLQQLHIQELPRAVHKHGDHQAAGGFDARPLLQVALQGQDVGLVSEAGMPAIADPGASVVRAAHLLGWEVVPLVGPVSLMLALAASGLSGQNFAFVGYLPQTGEERGQRIRALEQFCLRSGQTQLFIETPYRTAALLEALLSHLRPSTRLAVASGLTLPQARVRSATVAQWQQGREGLDTRLPAVFGIGA